jgi:lipoprotein-anchoring transpeptidase ErfK/SrfK
MTRISTHLRSAAFALTVATGSLWAVTAQGQSFLSYADQGPRSANAIFYQAMPQQEAEDAEATPAHLRRQIVSYQTREAPGTVIVDTPNTYLYYVLPGGKAVRYGIGVGREGFTWSGVKSVERKAEWPDWTPPPEMLARQPYLPRFMAGGPGNPLGARAMYISGTIYRIHGTNQPSSIGKQVSSGCIRMVNEDVIDLYGRVNVGSKVVVLPGSPAQLARRAQAASTTQAREPAPTSAYASARGVY